MQTPTTSVREIPIRKREAQQWRIDPAHSRAGFTVRHLMIANVRGEFEKLSGTVRWDPARPEATEIDVAIDVASIDTRNEKRDEHLRSADFFDAEHWPTMTFRGAGARRRPDGTLEIPGSLTIRGTSRPLVLEVEGPTPEQVSPFGDVVVGASAQAIVKRSDWGMTWNAALETGGVLVGDEVRIAIDVELVKTKGDR